MAVELAADDIAYAQLARLLADALRTFARERHDDSKKEIARLQTQLCETRRMELLAEQDRKADENPPR
jgi:hypothetical protein